MKKIMALLCTVAMSVGLLAGCGSSSGDNQSVSGSDNTGDGGKVVMLACEPEVPAEKEAWEEVAADFEKETGIQVELRFQGTWSDIPQTLQQSKLAGDQIDIVRVGIGTISSTLGAAGGVKDLTDLASPLLDRYSDGMIDNCYYRRSSLGTSVL